MSIILVFIILIIYTLLWIFFFMPIIAIFCIEVLKHESKHELHTVWYEVKNAVKEYFVRMKEIIKGVK